MNWVLTLIKSDKHQSQGNYSKKLFSDNVNLCFTKLLKVIKLCILSSPVSHLLIVQLVNSKIQLTAKTYNKIRHLHPVLKFTSQIFLCASN